jgi:hypothetical protein
MTIEKITDYVTVKISKYSTYLSEVQEYKEAFAEGRKVYEPSKLEIVSEENLLFLFKFLFSLTRKNDWNTTILPWEC